MNMYNRFLPLLLLTFVFSSCEKYEAPDYPKIPGYYSLKSVSCFCDPPRLSTLPHQEQCHIDFENNTLTVFVFGNNVTPRFLEPGEYFISIIENTITINGQRFGYRKFEDSMTFDSGSAIGVADFPVFSFVKN